MGSWVLKDGMQISVRILFGEGFWEEGRYKEYCSMDRILGKVDLYKSTSTY